MITDWTFYAAALPAVAVLGLAKGGFGGLGLLAIPLMALVVSPVQAAAILLPVLIVQDVVTVWAYRRTFDRPSLRFLIPGSVLGVLAGWLVAARMSEAVIRIFVGLIAVGFTLHMAARARRGLTQASLPATAPGLFWGTVSGFTSFVSHAGGPPFQVYVLPQRLSPAIYAGTSGVFFAVVNALKLGPYAALGQFSAENLLTAAALFPIAIASNLLGVWLVRQVEAGLFYRIIYALTLLVGLKLIWDGARALGA